MQRKTHRNVSMHVFFFKSHTALKTLEVSGNLLTKGRDEIPSNVKCVSLHGKFAISTRKN